MLSPVADLLKWADSTPTSTAIATPHRTYTFAQLATAVDAVAARLHDRGISAGQLVGVDLPATLEWIVDLALFRLGARTASLWGVSSAGSLRADALITGPGRRALATAVSIEVDELWVDAAVASAGSPPPVADFVADDAIFRYILTSGTTGGVSKAAAYSIGAFTHRMADGHLHWTDGRNELTLIGLSTTGGFHAAVACLNLGIPYLAIERIDAPTMQFAADQGIEVLCGSPTQVATALHVVRDAGIALSTVREVRLAGAGPSEGLLHLIDETLGVPVRGVYGSTEGGGISQVWYRSGGDRFDVGAVLPDVELEVVDESGAVLPAGIEGYVRYRTPGLVSGYLVDGRVEPFPGGWFVPGDLATLSPSGSLTLGGRDSEIFNVGGLKVDPTRIDDLAHAFPGVKDAAAFRVERREGLPEVGLAIVSDPDCDLRMLDAQLREKLPHVHPTVFWRIAEIPRTRLGKPMRATITEQYAKRPRA